MSKVKAVYVFDEWLAVGSNLPPKFVFIGDRFVEEISVELSDPRNFSGVPANIYIKFTDGFTAQIQARDVMVIRDGNRQ